MSYTTTISNNNVTISVENTEHSISLSRTGGQGTRGDSISRIYFDVDKNLLVEIVNSAGTVIETINAGSLKERIDLIDLLDVDYSSITDGDFIIYEATTQKFTTHTFTTNSITDIDNTNKTDGAMFIYNGTANKYVSTTELANPNLNIIGGTF